MPPARSECGIFSDFVDTAELAELYSSFGVAGVQRSALIPLVKSHP